ncbi:hypothetical protein RHGRI_032320 [Rhododendron griersonianum]|uniref:STAS domain-containing protein n=1 Tax=Rhododendron griersonianum TaxID=479676 RepID=A0AAV6IBB7_9ERIC|nr:hypothetical protein RHGRI_032320 [Rhododendron griersonianum]
MSGRVTDDIEIDVIRSPSSRHHVENLPYVHKVGLPPKQKLLKEFTSTLKEIFFHDEPLRHFKDQPKSRKLVLGLQALFPILEWGRDYNLSKFKGDLISGLTIASLAIPQDIGYAKLANLDPQYALYSSFVTPLVYAFMGSSRDIAIGPVAVVSLLLGTLLQKEINPSNKVEYERLAFTATFFAGITQATLGVLRLGFLIDFLSHAAIVGFMAGAAITIGLQQLKGFLGIKTFTKKTDIVSVMRSVWTTVHHGGKKHRKWFWVPAIAPLISVIIATFFVFITHADKHGVAIVNHIKKGVNPASANQIFFTGGYLLKGFKIGVVAGLIALTESTAIGRTFAAIKDYELDGNKEMVALGTMNVIGSMTSCYVSTVLTPLFKYTPNAVISAIIISAVVGLIDIQAMILIWKIDKLDFIACMGAFFGVVFVSVEIGLLIAVGISFAKILLQVTRPRTALLGKLPRTSVYRNINQYPDATKVPGILILRVDSAIYFSNSNYVKERILRWLTDEEEQVKANKQTKIQYLIVEMSPVSDIDTSGLHALEELYRTLQKREIQLVLANPGQAVIDKLYASGFPNLIGEDKIFLTVADAVLTYAPKTEEP